MDECAESGRSRQADVAKACAFHANSAYKEPRKARSTRKKKRFRVFRVFCGDDLPACAAMLRRFGRWSGRGKTALTPKAIDNIRLTHIVASGSNRVLGRGTV